MSVDKNKAVKAKGSMVDSAKVMAEVLSAAKAAFKRWKPGDPPEKLALIFAGELNSSIGRSAGLHMPSEAMVREEAAQELRDAAEKFPKGSSKRANFLEAADLVEQGNL